ncbi:MAG: hypothetical protein JXA77_13370 [Bacteroidales bacterium]|nr:hypothetical protein [Bacteroidales bacterium]MBN2818507.1 hypothetical protein [Bacteroidales bacterium]
MGITLKEDTFYRIKLAGSDGGWWEKTAFFYIKPESKKYSNTTLDGKYYCENTMTITSSTVASGAVLEAGESITVNSGTTIGNNVTLDTNSSLVCQ